MTTESSWKYKPWRQYVHGRGWDNGTYRINWLIPLDGALGAKLRRAYEWVEHIVDPAIRKKMGVPQVLFDPAGWRITVGFVERKRLLPHPQSKQSYKKIMRKIGNALQIVQAGPANNCSYRVGDSSVTVSKQYHDAVETLKLYREKIQRIEGS